MRSSHLDGTVLKASRSFSSKLSSLEGGTWEKELAQDSVTIKLTSTVDFLRIDSGNVRVDTEHICSNDAKKRKRISLQEGIGKTECIRGDSLYDWDRKSHSVLDKKQKSFVFASLDGEISTDTSEVTTSESDEGDDEFLFYDEAAEAGEDV